MDLDEEDLFDVFDRPAAAAAAADAAVPDAVKKASSAVKRPPASPSAPKAAKRARTAGGKAEKADKAEAGSEEASEKKDSKHSKQEAEDEEAHEPPPSAFSSLPKRSKKKRDDFGAYKEQHVVQTKSLEEDGCLAVRCFPPGVSKEDADRMAAEPAPTPAKPAKTYPFTLDPFQREAVSCLERNQSVLVSAHTSAGKTVVAEYAVAIALRDGQRVIYTSPIKALSNQKYRELHEEFEDVGLMTGDVTINPSASCLVMTTEILRSMLYRGSEVMREVSWVVFDEIHYMRDKDRGVVWEETLILLPHKVRFVFLSATIPNATEFAAWIAKLHDQPCEIVYTDYRPTPLQFFVFPSGGSGLHLVVDADGKFKEANFQKAIAEMDAAAEAESEANSRQVRKGAGDKKKKRQQKNKKVSPNDIYKVIKTLHERQYLPLIVFSFSKRDCESHALALSKLDFNGEDEKKLVSQIFANAIDSLSEDDRRLPQVESILPLLRRGIGIHHGGLLPILKEVIEILFTEGLLKCLFATETFAMGVNAPARTVLFTASRKFDGEAFRVISGGEMVQMAGRAGRRGLDSRGLVILMLDDKLEPPVAKNLLKGQADPLNSSFHLGYNTILNLLRVEEADPQYVMQRSFAQFQATREAPRLRKELEAAEAEAAAVVVPEAELVASYHRIATKIAAHQEQLRAYFTQPVYCLQFLNPGRLVRVRGYGWGALVTYGKTSQAPASALRGPGDSAAADPKSVYVLEVLLQVEPPAAAGGGGGGAEGDADAAASAVPAPVPEPRAAAWKGAARKLPVMLSAVLELGSIRLQLPKNPAGERGQATFVRTMRQVVQRMPDGIPALDPIEDMRVNDEGCRAVVKQLQKEEGRLQSHALSTRADRAELLALHDRKLELRERCDSLRKRIKESERNIVLLDTLHKMKRVLRRLGFADESDVAQIKGMVACEISTCDELLATELIFAGVFNDLTPEQAVALCSVMVFTERASKDDDSKAPLREELAGPFRQLVSAVRRIAEVKRDAQLEIDVEDYVGQFTSQAMEVVYEWCKGAKFAEIMQMTDLYEGSIIRAMRRLEEFLRQMSQAAKTIGNEELEAKFLTGIERMKRDIVFAASLYL